MCLESRFRMNCRASRSQAVPTLKVGLAPDSLPGSPNARPHSVPPGGIEPPTYGLGKRCAPLRSTPGPEAGRWATRPKGPGPLEGGLTDTVARTRMISWFPPVPPEGCQGAAVRGSQVAGDGTAFRESSGSQGSRGHPQSVSTSGWRSITRDIPDSSMGAVDSVGRREVIGSAKNDGRRVSFPRVIVRLEKTTGSHLPSAGGVSRQAA
jgi:hypothetical protein